MTTKVCTNVKCSCYAQLVYTVAMRCVICRWDLKSANRNAELSGARIANGRAHAEEAIPREAGERHASA